VRENAQWAYLETLRKAGFRVVSIDSPLHEMLNRNKNNRELTCQLSSGPGSRLCPSYRGPAYQAELQRLRREAALARPTLLTADIELWTWTGPVDAPKCERCKADFARSGLKDWKEWQVAKGVEIWRDLVTAVREGAREGGGPVPEVGGYDFRPGEPYQFFWSVDRLYPEWIHGSEVSTYSALEPYHLALIGDEVRRDRKALGRSDVIPWLTPGDAGVFPGWAFRDALLECFANGARGLLFWSSRVWDTECLAAYADAIRVVTPVEDVIVEGDLLTDATAQPPIRLCGMRKGDDVFLLAADYAGKARVPVQIKVPIAKECVVEDLETGKEVARIRPNASLFTVQFVRPGARPFRVRPATP
ncbi:MAG: hypothetical protein QHJ73_04840, partial [Armatimonadota bacterium]|nr:hypothetical protein [Armatimonadota bacterium]